MFENRALRATLQVIKVNGESKNEMIMQVRRADSLIASLRLRPMEN